jgi:hypothetical protein
LPEADTGHFARPLPLCPDLWIRSRSPAQRRRLEGAHRAVGVRQVFLYDYRNRARLGALDHGGLALQRTVSSPFKGRSTGQRTVGGEHPVTGSFL